MGLNDIAKGKSGQFARGVVAAAGLSASFGAGAAAFNDKQAAIVL